MRQLRLSRMRFVFSVLLFLLFARLFQLQILEGSQWSEEALRSRLHRHSIPAQRGGISDRQGVILAEDREAYDLMFEYRAFRRNQPSAQILEAYALLGKAPGGLPQCLDHGERLGNDLFNLRPSALVGLTNSSKRDFLFYLRRLGNVSDAQAALYWMEDGVLSFSEAFPSAAHHFQAALEKERRMLMSVEDAMHHPWPEGLLARLEEERKKLEARVRLHAARIAAGRSFEASAFEVREWLMGEGPEAKEKKTFFLNQLSQRWKWTNDLPSLEETLSARGDTQALGTHLGSLLRHVETISSPDLFGVRRALVREVHQNRVVRLSGDIPFLAVDRLARKPRLHAGLYLEENPRRVYPDQGAPHLVGLVRSANPEDLKEYQDLREEYRGLARMLTRTESQSIRFQSVRKRLYQQVIRPGETRGRTGVESAYENILRGRRGFLQLLDAGEEDLRPKELEFSAPRPGRDIRLSVDVRAIRAAEVAVEEAYAWAQDRLRVAGKTDALAPLENRRVGFALLDLRDGSLPVLATTPTFTVSEYQQGFGDLVRRREAGPLRHRALGGGFLGHQAPYPGSTFKLVAAAAALAENPEEWERERECLGSWAPPGSSRALWCDSRSGHGKISMREAIQKSCNVYFYRLAADLGYRLLWTRARQLGFGLPSGLELSVLEPKEEEVIATGSGAWLERGANSLTHPRKAASPLAPLHFAIGQGYVTASPLQMARFYGWLATGKLATPRLVLEGAGGAPALPETDRFLLSSASRVKLMDALRSVVEEQGGTAWDPETSLALHRVSGKTGTAQVGGGENHAWFAGYFPWDKPRYAFAVFCENVDLHGGELATLVLDRFLQSPEVAFLHQEDSP